MPFINRCGGGSVVGTTLKDVMDQIVSYNSVITVNGEERSNLLVQPSDFSEANYLEPKTGYASLSVVEDADAEGGKALLMSNSGQSNSGMASYLYDRVAYETTIPNTTSGGTYLVTIRARSSAYAGSPSSVIVVAPYNIATGYDYDSAVTISKAWYTSFPTRLTTGYSNYHFLLGVADNRFLQRVALAVSMLASSTEETYSRPDYYIDWMSVYDVSGIDLTAYDAFIQSAY